jgi:ubiquinone/menaquinone biosynthesis C-methylase UbiE
MDLKSKERFTDRAKNYSKYRPSYAESLIEYLITTIDLKAEDKIADIGSGTGISSKLFLDFGNTVYGIEPNSTMRCEAEEKLKIYDAFYSIESSAEKTELDDNAVDHIVSAQAFHWFDPIPTKEEFARILKPNGSVILLWNIRESDADDFTGNLMKIIEKYSANFTKVNEKRDIVKDFFGNTEIIYKKIPNPQFSSLERIVGELSSYSYLPNEGQENYQNMTDEVQVIFDKFKNDEDEVVLTYTTNVHIGKII